MGMINWGQKSKPIKLPRAYNKTPQKSLDQKLTHQKFHAEFQVLIISTKDCTLLTELRGKDTQALPTGHYHEFSDGFQYPKNIPT